MLRVTTLYASSAGATAAYYTQYLTQAPGEVPGVWSGVQADRLGLHGVVGGDVLQALLEGRDPVLGTPLGQPLADRHRTDGSVVRAVAGFDATFSAPKSVSVLWVLTGDPGFLDVHDQAVTATLAHREHYGAITRVRVNGDRVFPDTNGLTMATFRQATSREDDPQLHTHAVISAKVQTADGRWWALDARYLKRHQRMLGGLYQSALRAGLSERFGVVWGPVVNGQAEIAGVPDDLLQALSKRTAQVEAALEAKLAEFRGREGRDPSRWERAALTRQAAVDTRAHKTGNGVADLVTRWQVEANELGCTAASVWSNVIGAARDRPPAARVTTVDVLDRLSTSGRRGLAPMSCERSPTCSRRSR